MGRDRAGLLLLLLLAGCESRAVSRSRDARVETHEMLRDDLAAERSPADGGGRATLASGSRSELRVGERARIEILYEAGPLGVETGGAVVLQTSPFWGWDPPQSTRPEAPGFTEAATDAEGIALEPSTFPGLVAFHVRGRKLEAGERIRIVYGAGEAEARVDSYRERRSRIWIAVDGDGDGVRAVIPDSPWVDVLPGEPARLVLLLPSTARPGEAIRLQVALLDAFGNHGVDFQGRVEISSPAGLELPETIPLSSDDSGLKAVEGRVTAPGVFRVRAEAPTGLTAESNPLVARDEIPRLLWGDLHGHSQLSDGTGTPEDYFLYARDVAALDVVALTDHDHWGVLPLDANPGLWKSIVETARAFHLPGRFVTLLGYEWTSWLHGHRHVIYFEDEGELLSSLDPRYESPALLWDALAGRSALTFAHHSAGGPVSTNWDFVPPPEIEPVTEIVSVHGSSEASDSPGKIYSAVEGNFVRDVLDRGFRLGFIGSGDSHDGHPGLAHLASPGGGLAAIFAEERTRESVLEALRSRRVYATNGARIWLRSWLDDEPMGSILEPPVAGKAGGAHELRFAVAGTAAVERIDVVRSGRVIARVAGSGRRELSERLELPPLAPEEYVYLRVVQEDGGVAWSSPVFVGKRGPGGETR